KIAAEDDSAIVEFEALGGVYASDLTDTIRIGRPELCLWDSRTESGAVRLGIPRHRPIPNNDIVNQVAAGGIRPGPAKAGDQSAGESFEMFLPNPLIERLDTVHNLKFKWISNVPQHM